MRLGGGIVAAVMLLGLGGATGWAQADRPIRVACLGDNLTSGTGLATPEEESYPAQLAQILGPGWEVANFGVAGVTILPYGEAPLYRQHQMPSSIQFEPDLLIIMLGTNDSKPRNWVHARRFASDYRDLIQSFLGLDAAPSIWIALPPPAFGTPADGVQPEVLRDEVLAQIREVAAGLPVTLLDLHSPLVEHPEWFPDGVNPDATGARRIAELVFAAIRLPPASGDGSTPP